MFYGKSPDFTFTTKGGVIMGAVGGGSIPPINVEERVDGGAPPAVGVNDTATPKMNGLEVRALAILRMCLGEKIEIIPQYEQLPGLPDFFIPSISLVVWCDGDFWHPSGRREKMRRAAIRLYAAGKVDKAEFWADKADTNQARDRDNNRSMRELKINYVRLKEARLRSADAAAEAYVSRSIAMALFKKRRAEKKRRERE